jgi:hypothetical protein
MVKSTTKSPKKSVRKTSKAKKSFTMFQTGLDFTIALLIVSLLANAFVICLWVALKTTDDYDAALMSFFLGR